MTGKDYIDNLFYDLGKIQVLTTDTNLRTIALSWFNRVIKDISANHPHWNWLEKTAIFSTIINQMTYDLPTDIDLSGRKVFTLRQKNSPVKITYIDQRLFDEMEPKPNESTGEPFYYTIYANQIRLWPVPSAVEDIYMRYLRLITVLTDSASSITDIPAKFDEIVISGAKVHAFRMFPEWGNSTEQMAIYKAGILEMIRDNNIALDDDRVSFKHGYEQTGMVRRYPWDSTNVG